MDLGLQMLTVKIQSHGPSPHTDTQVLSSFQGLPALNNSHQLIYESTFGALAALTSV